MIDNYDIQRLRALNIESVAARLNILVSHHKAICPFHEDSHPSLTFNTRRNTYRCYVCDAHGDPIDLVMNSLRKSFPDSCRWLADESNIIIEEQKKPVKKVRVSPQPVVDVRHLSHLICQPYLNEEARNFLFEKRRLHPAVVKWLGISSISSPVPMSSDVRSSWFNAPSILIPYKDIDGNLLSVQARHLDCMKHSNFQKSSEAEKQYPRFQFPKGSQCHIFNLPVLRLLKHGEELWIAEGVSDCMALLSSGRKAIAIPSATLLKNEDVELLTKLNSDLSTSFHMFPDQDAAGQQLYLNLKEKLPNLHHHQLPEDFKDFGDYWSSEQKAPIH